MQSPDEADIGGDCDAVAFATPDRVSMGYAAALADAGVRFLDYSGDFRFPDEASYARYAAAHPSIGDSAHEAATLLGRASYGVPELYAEAVAEAPIVGNPGCFAVGITLGLAPLFADKLVEGGSVVVDGLTGSSGAGQEAGGRAALLAPQRQRRPLPRVQPPTRRRGGADARRPRRRPRERVLRPAPAGHDARHPQARCTSR